MRKFTSVSTVFIALFLFVIIYGCKTSDTVSDDVVTTDTDEIVLVDPVINDEVLIDAKEEKEESTVVSPGNEVSHGMESDVEGSDMEVSPSTRQTKSAMMETDDAMLVSSATTRRAKSIPGEKSTTIIIPGDNPNPIAGQITAAEWNDLYNWNDWKELLDNQDFNEMQTHWNLFPRTRYSVFVKNKYELPLHDEKVELMDESGKILWEARTDNSGKAELWADFNSRDKSFEIVHARVTTKNQSYVVENLKTIEEGVNHIEIDQACITSPNVDIVFAVDATGSMGDEISFLQSELKDVINRSVTSNTNLKVRMGAVFYRDSTDQYVTKVQPLSDDPNETLAFIAAQSAKGGGDYPEAVDAALEESLSQDWSEEAVARIIFLLLDAPPHHNKQVLARIQSQVAEAAAEGIKIIPITASGINRQTEFLMKFMAIATNGTYVFITDHSGIGNPHLDPVVKDYEVEKLNNLLVRLLYNYTKSNGCDANEPINSGITLFPNPASDFINLNSDKPIRQLKLLSNSGKLMSTRSNLSIGETRISLEGLIDGVYTIQLTGEGTDQSIPFVVITGR